MMSNILASSKLKGSHGNTAPDPVLDNHCATSCPGDISNTDDTETPRARSRCLSVTGVSVPNRTRTSKV